MTQALTFPFERRIESIAEQDQEREAVVLGGIPVVPVGWNLAVFFAKL